MSESRIVVFCDGAAKGNPGPGGWGVVIATPVGDVIELGAATAHTTNNKMELTAAIQALTAISTLDGPVAIHTDSTYVIKGISGWIWGWRKRGWKTAEGTDVLNRELWQTLDGLVNTRGPGQVSWHYVRGHSGIPGNERVDAIADGLASGPSIALYRGPLAQGQPTADQLQRDYLDPGTEGLRSFVKARNVTAARIADAIAQQPQVYADAKRCLAVLPRVRARLQTVLQRLGDLYPEMRSSPVAVVVGRGRPVAIGDPAGGVRIGLEALCAADGLDPDPEERFVQVIAHEYAHVQQSLFLNDEKNTTVLQTALAEGGAEFTAELISDKVSNARLMTLAKGRELQIETAFVPDQDKTDLSKWFYNHPGTPEWPPTSVIGSAIALSKRTTSARPTSAWR